VSRAGVTGRRPTSSTGATRDLDRFAERFRRANRLPGLAVLLARNGRPLLSRGYGFRDVAARLPVTPRTVFGVASITKSFTALAILRLQEDGRLRVADPVRRHLPEFRTPDPRWGRRIRLSHFLSHSSGLPPLPSIYYTSGRSIARDPPYDPRVARRVGIDPDRPPIDTYEGLLEYLATEKYRLLGPPGAQFSYSNEAFGLLGAVVERASGRTYESYVEEEILRPAGLRSTMFDTGIMLRQPEVTTLYSPARTGGGRRLVASQDWWEDTCLRSAGALRTNLEDLGRYTEIFRTGGRVGRERIVSAASVAAMTRPRVPIAHGGAYGFGLFVQADFPGGPIVYHSGGLKGVSSIFFVQPRTGIATAALANLELVPSGSVALAGVNLLLGRPAKEPLRRIPESGPPRRSLREYAGFYCSGEGIWARFRTAGRGLRLDFIGIELTFRNVRLRPIGGDEFAAGPRGRPTWWIEFRRDRAGRVGSVHLGGRIVRRRRPAELRRARSGGMVW
jgi:CubicO group peptidase (beta-lactamase class C family)